MWAVLHHTASAKVLYANPPDFAEMQAWRQLLKPGDLFVDIGSNVGSYALWAADCGAEAIAVEPASASARLLKENVALNSGSAIHVYQCALADEPGEMWLTEGLDAMNHLLVEGVEGERVEVRTLDDVLGSRSAVGVKIDVEGAERLVLAGASSALKSGRLGTIQLEWNELSESVFGESRQLVADILAEHGYEFFRPDSSGVLHPVEHLGCGADLFAVLTP